MSNLRKDIDWTDQLAGYALGDLTPDEAAAVKQQLNQHPALGQELRAYQETLALLPEALPRQQPSAGLKLQLLNAASAGEEAAQVLTPTPVAAASEQTASNNASKTNSTDKTPSPNRVGSRWITGGAIAIAAVSLATLGFITGRLGYQAQRIKTLREQLDEGQVKLDELQEELTTGQAIAAFLRQPQTQMRTMQGSILTGISPAPTARILIQPGERDIIVLAENLLPLASDQNYRLWVIAEPNAAPTDCGQFHPNEQGIARWTAPHALCTLNPFQLVITLNGTEDATTAVGPIIMQSDIRPF